MRAVVDVPHGGVSSTECAHFPLLEAVDLPILDAPILDVDAIMLLPPWAVPGRVL